MTIPEVNLRELTFSEPGRKERAYKADEVDAVLSDMQDTLDAARSQEVPSAGENAVSEEIVGQLKASNVALNQEIESLIASNADLEDQNRELHSRVTDLESALANVQDVAPVSPYKEEVTHASQLIERAHTIASDHIAEAKVIAASIVGDKERELIEMQSEINTLIAYKDSIVEDLSGFLTNTIETVNDYKGAHTVSTETFEEATPAEAPVVEEPVAEEPVSDVQTSEEPVSETLVIEETVIETPVVEEEESLDNTFSFDQDESFEVLPSFGEEEDAPVVEDLAPEVEELVFDLTNTEPVFEENEGETATSPAETVTYDLVDDTVEPVSYSEPSDDSSFDLLPEDSTFEADDDAVVPSADDALTELPSFDAVVAGDADYLNQSVEVDFDFTDSDFNLEDDSEK